MPADLDALDSDDAAEAEPPTAGGDSADDDDDGGSHDQLLGNLKRSLLSGKFRKRETGPPAASGAMDAHSLRRRQHRPAAGVHDVLATALAGQAARRAVGEELRTARRRHKVLEAPEKLIEAKSQRIAAYEMANKDLGRWYGYVERNRLAEAVAFPLPPTDAPRPQSAADYRHRARADIAAATAAAAAAPSTGGTAADDLESRLYRRLYSEAAIARAAAGGDPDAAAAVASGQFDSAKMRERLATSRRLTARRHYLEARLKRQARIKSKAHRRHARRARLKQEVAELTALKEADPAAFAERMTALERARADERISQRHRGGSKFARQQKLRAKFDDSARQAVQDMLERGRDLVEKTDGAGDGDGGSGASSDSEDAEEAEAVAQLPADLLDEWNLPPRDGDENDNGKDDEALPAALRPARIPDFAAAGPPPTVGPAKPLELDLSHLPALATAEAADDEDGDAVEPAQQQQRQKRRELARLRTDELLAEEAAVGNNHEEEEGAAEEFEREKAAVADQEQPKDVDLFLAGWNTWTGPGTRPVAPERRQQFVIKAPKRKRRDAAFGHVIIRERLESSAARRRHLVKEVPFPYSNAEQFELAMRTPVCREFNSIRAHKQLTAPKVALAMGRAIGPVPKAAILRRKRSRRTNTDIAAAAAAPAGSSSGSKK